jgi:transposase-like protein
VTPELRDAIVAALNAGATSAAAAKQFGVSVPTVHNVKKAAGLTKSRKAKA